LEHAGSELLCSLDISTNSIATLVDFIPRPDLGLSFFSPAIESTSLLISSSWMTR
jgi:hypothetical protein